MRKAAGRTGRRPRAERRRDVRRLGRKEEMRLFNLFWAGSMDSYNSVQLPKMQDPFAYFRCAREPSLDAKDGRGRELPVSSLSHSS